MDELIFSSAQGSNNRPYTGLLLWALFLGGINVSVGEKTPNIFYFDAILPLWLLHQAYWKGFSLSFSDWIVRLGCLCIASGLVSSLLNYEDMYKSLASLKILFFGLLVYAIMKRAPPGLLTLSLWGAAVGVLLLRNFHELQSIGNLADVAFKAEVGIVLGRSNIVASDLLLVFPVAVAGISFSKGIIRLLFAGSAMLIFAGLIATMSRGAMASLLLATCLSLRLLWKAGVRVRHVLAVLVLAFGVIALLPSGMIETDVVLIANRLSNADLSREELMSASWQAFKENPVLGVGPGQLGNAISHIETVPPDNAAHMNAHNLILNSLAENGVVGGVAFLAMIGIGLWRALRVAVARPTALNVALWLGFFAAVMHNMVEASIEGEEFQVMFWTLAAMIANQRCVDSSATLNNATELKPLLLHPA